MSTLVRDLGVELPVLAAPMAGGPTTPDLVRAAAAVGSLGFLAAGYQTATALAADIAQVRAWSIPYGVNLFVPNAMPVDRAAYRRYAERLGPEAARYGIALSGAEPLEDDDDWTAKVELLVAQPVPLISFTFGLPEPGVLAALSATGARLMQTVTSVDEARAAAAAGLDAVALQGSAAGGHYGTWSPLDPPRPGTEGGLSDLVAAVRAAIDLPVIAAGGLASADEVRDVLAAGAEAVAVGTALLRADEAGTSRTHREALADPERTRTVVTHAFTGRPARALANAFTEQYAEVAPYGYPAIHHLTRPLRRAAAAAGDPERVHLWAGTGFRAATAEPAGRILERLGARR